jgi:hypothetical protein
LAAKLAAASLQARGFCPLPVMGLPGWSPANTDPAFYQDEQVFRRGRMRRKPALDHRPPDSPRFPPSLKTP